MMRKTFLLLAIAVCFAILPETKASPIEEGVHTIQIYSPWNEYYGRIYKGYEHGMMPGQRFIVWRGEKRLGTFVVSDVSESISRGKFIPDSRDFYITENIAVGENEIADMLAKESAKTPESKVYTAEKDKNTDSKTTDTITVKTSISENSDSKGPDYYKFELVEPDKDTSNLIPRISKEKTTQESDIKITAISDNEEPEVNLYSDSAMPGMVEPVEDTQKNRFWTFHQHVSAGRSLYDLMQFEAAIDNFSSALRLSPDNYEVQNLFIAAAIKLGIMGNMMEEPLTNFGGNAPAVDPVIISKGRNNYGAFLLSKNKYDDALEQFTLALINNPGDPVFYRNRALALFKLGDTEGAIDSAKSAVDLGDETSSKLLQILVDSLPASE